MRRSFADSLLQRAKEDFGIYLLVGDLGYKLWDEFAETLPAQFINVGAAESTLLDVAVGLAYAGKTPVCYSITTFLIYRPFETLRTYISHESLHVILAGSGRDKDYEHDGFSHDASDVKSFLKPLKIKSYFPNRKEEIPTMLDEMLTNKAPAFVSLKR